MGVTDQVEAYINQLDEYNPEADYYVYILTCERQDGLGVDKYVGLTQHLMKRMKCHIRYNGHFRSYGPDSDGDFVAMKEGYVDYEIVDADIQSINGSNERARWIERRTYMQTVRTSNCNVLGGK